MYLDVVKLSKEFASEDLVERNKKIGTMVVDAYNQSKTALVGMARSWQEDVLFWQGEQYLHYNNTIDQYEPLPYNQYTDYIPQPTDNLMLPTANTMVSMLVQNKPSAVITENSDSPEDKNRARLSESILKAKWAIDNEQPLYRVAANIGVITGNCYRKDFWDTSGMQTVRVNLKNDDGTVIVKEAPLGDNGVKILTPFEMVPDLLNAIHNLDDGHFIMEGQPQDVEFIKSQFSQEGNGYTGEGKNVKADENVSISLSYLDALRDSSMSDSYEGRSDQKNRAVLIECYTMPVKDHAPKGLKIVVCNEKLLYIGESPYTYGDNLNWHPYTHWKYQDHPFRHYGMGLLEHIIPIQKRYNAILALQVLNRQTMAIPQWLVPNGSMELDDQPTGEPGAVFNYDEINGNRPTRIDGKGLDASVSMEQDKAEEKIHVIAGDNEVLQGRQPSGVTTATALNLLLEQSMSIHSPKIQGWEEFIGRSQSKKLNLIRRKYKEPRESLINRVKALNSNNKIVEIKDTFTGDALGDNIDVKIEAGSTLPRLKAAQQSSLMEMYGAQLLGDLNPDTNPVGNRDFLEKMGIQQFTSSVSGGLKKAEWENDQMRQDKRDEIKAIPIDEHVIHFKTILKEIDRPEFFEANEENIIKLYNDHAMEHWNMMDDPQKGLLGLSQKAIVKIDESQNIYGLGLTEQAQPAVEERLNGLEQFAQQTEQLVSQLLQSQQMGATPEMGVNATAPAEIPVGVVPDNIPPGMA